MSIADSLLALNTMRQQIIAAIESKGVTVGDVGLNTLAAKVSEITVGGSGGGSGNGVVTIPDRWERPFDWTPRIDLTGQNMIAFHLEISPTVNRPNMSLSLTTNTGTIVVDWGDGTTNIYASNVNKVTHSYASFVDLTVPIVITVKSTNVAAVFTNISLNSAFAGTNPDPTICEFKKIEIQSNVACSGHYNFDGFISTFIEKNIYHNFFSVQLFNVKESVECITSCSYEEFQEAVSSAKYIKINTVLYANAGNTPIISDNRPITDLISLVVDNYLPIFNGVILFNDRNVPCNPSSLQELHFGSLPNFNDSYTYSNTLNILYNTTGVAQKLPLRKIHIGDCGGNLGGIASIFTGIDITKLEELVLPNIYQSNGYFFPIFNNHATPVVFDFTLPELRADPQNTVFQSNYGIGFQGIKNIRHFNASFLPLHNMSNISNCPDLESVTAAIGDSSFLIFQNCPKLKSINVAFEYMYSLSRIDFSSSGIPASEIERILNLIPPPFDGYGQITLYGVPEAIFADVSIATAKGWEVYL